MTARLCAIHLVNGILRYAETAYPTDFKLLRYRLSLKDRDEQAPHLPKNLARGKISSRSDFIRPRRISPPKVDFTLRSASERLPSQLRYLGVPKKVDVHTIDAKKFSHNQAQTAKIKRKQAIGRLWSHSF